ncbi:hypothetical protein CTEN210_06795 [Chaetoceros tenuissimus]|uniref:G-protein coupled receptors family 1 profile domain-containing protein n=1 Tax=Chaetoceros tenuissimus TaxID=426638 RepID=A0AAD3CR71_9STRA|nr:hypothetical protein CTEN210_06795 [Chaetoceros tenuissimus]
MSTPSQLIKASQVIRCVMSSTSLLGSSTIAYMILNSPRGLQSPYSRIIFGMSIADIMQSQGFLLSPFVNIAPDALWNVNGGNETACEAVGTINTLGSIAGPFYSLFLIYYFLQRVKYKVKPTDFSKQKKEAWIHIFIWLYPFIFTCWALYKKQINSSRYGSVCMIVPKPFGCWLDDSCERGEDAPITLFISTNIPWVLVFFGIVCLLTFLTLHVYRQERLFMPSSAVERLSAKDKRSNASATHLREVSKNLILSKEASSEQASSEKGTASSTQPPAGTLMSDLHFPISTIYEEECKVEVDEEQEEKVEQPMFAVIASNSDQGVDRDTEQAANLDTVEFLITKQSFHQSGLYILAFFLAYFCVVLEIFLSIAKVPSSDWTFLVISIFLPSNGLFNILIYTRPKVLILKKKYPRLSWIERFLSVIYCGGEIPIAMDDPNLSEKSSPPIRQVEVEDSRLISSNANNDHWRPFGVPIDSNGDFDSGRFNVSSIEDE